MFRVLDACAYIISFILRIKETIAPEEINTSKNDSKNAASKRKHTSRVKFRPKNEPESSLNNKSNKDKQKPDKNRYFSRFSGTIFPYSSNSRSKYIDNSIAHNELGDHWPTGGYNMKQIGPDELVISIDGTPNANL